MNIKEIHPWNLSPKEAIALQRKLSAKVIGHVAFDKVDVVAGADIAIDTETNEGIAAVIAFSYPDLEELEQAVIRWAG